MGANILIQGQGGGVAGSGQNSGVQILDSALVQPGGLGALSVIGLSGGGSGGLSRGVNLGSSAQLTSSGGSVTVQGSSIASSAISIFGGSITTATNGGDVSIIGDSMNFILASDIAAKAGNTVTLRPLTNGTKVDVGGIDVPGELGLTDTELDFVSSGDLAIGNANSGTVTISSAIDRATSTNVLIQSGDAIVTNPGSINTAGGTLKFDAGVGGVQPITSGTDVTASTVSFAAGDNLAISIAGTAVDTQYRQLSVSGTVNLSGSNLVLSGAYVPVANDSFTVVSATTVSGIFNGLPNLSVVSFNAKPLIVQYTLNSVTLFAENLGLDGSGNLLYTSPNGRSDDMTVVVSGSNYIISDASPTNVFWSSLATAGNGTNAITIPMASITGNKLLFNTGDQSDKLTVSWSGGSLSDAVEYDGGSGASDL